MIPTAAATVAATTIALRLDGMGGCLAVDVGLVLEVLDVVLVLIGGSGGAGDDGEFEGDKELDSLSVWVEDSDW